MKQVNLVLSGVIVLAVAACGGSGAGQAGPATRTTGSSAEAGSGSAARSGGGSQTGGGATPTVTWRGRLAGYGGPAWQGSWGYLSDGSFGQGQLSVVRDASAPGGGPVLRVLYGQGSSASSCGNCPNPGGGQFYTSFADSGRADLANAPILYLRYYVKFEAGFDFGRGGKLPGLYGGPPRQESGGHHGQAFSTRYMWRDHPIAGSLTACSRVLPCAEVYLYSPQVTHGYGEDIGGSWHWQGDSRWHMVEQRVDRLTGDITVWYDGTQALSSPGALAGVAGIPFSGIFFSTFFGGHETSWGPSRSEYAYFAGFAVSTRYIGAQ